MKYKIKYQAYFIFIRSKIKIKQFKKWMRGITI
jgi:hypothetical protein